MKPQAIVIVLAYGLYCAYFVVKQKPWPEYTDYLGRIYNAADTAVPHVYLDHAIPVLEELALTPWEAFEDVERIGLLQSAVCRIIKRYGYSCSGTVSREALEQMLSIYEDLTRSVFPHVDNPPEYELILRNGMLIQVPLESH